MRITLRLVFALVVSATLVAAASTYFQVKAEQARLYEDLERRSAILAETLHEIVEAALPSKDKKRLARVVQRYGNRERLRGLAILDLEAKPLAFTPALEGELPQLAEAARAALSAGGPVSRRAGGGGAERLDYALPVSVDEAAAGAVVLVHDASFIDAKLREMWRHNFFRLLVHATIIALVSLWVVRWSISAPMAQLAEWMKQARAGEPGERPPMPKGLFDPLAAEAGQMARSLTAARAAAEEEARLRRKAESVWTAERLKEHVRAKLEGRPLYVVANREPYMHVRKGRRVEVITPASGLVTGVEPVLLACDGMWVAHGAGDADRETADEGAKLRVPPDDPRYTLKRVWLTKEEEEGYYYGFSNEGLWPLCHIAHTRPLFEPADWAHYQAVNRKFADALLEEMAEVREPCILIQDYHFALLPRMLKEARPDARVAVFWHIPWPNPEAFGICPWQRDILHGLLGADILGFHVQFHCNNFLDTVDRALESRIDWERFAVQRGGHTTLVKPFPISIAFPPLTPPQAARASKEVLLKELGSKAQFLGVGVDRLDYTKGIVERFRGVERLLEKHPQYQGQFTFVELGAPSRVHIPRYRDLVSEVERESDRINWRFKTKDYKPIVLLERHHSHAEIDPYYRAADLCMVTSLHDGMNLVAKEFVAARDDEKGALILSRFTGAARELRDALIVNPYDSEQLADSIRYALEMDGEEQYRRMHAMREALKENNVYAWAASLIDELTRVRVAAAPAPAAAAEPEAKEG